MSAIGVAICDCPSAGHDMIFLDCRECGPQGEPKVVHIDQEYDYEITPLADSFEEFIRGLVNENLKPGVSEQTYLKEYPGMLTFGDGFTTGGYAPGFVEDWLKNRKKE